MKYLVLFLVISLTSCGECDNNQYYQIKVKNVDSTNGALCQYEAVGLGHCASWQSMQHIQFTDSCKKFFLSQILTHNVVMAEQQKKSSL